MDCKVCGNLRSNFVMNNRRVCFRCDELLFDLEIELEESEKPASTDRSPEVPASTEATTPQRTKP